MLAARERGLGTAWTTMTVQSEREVAELLNIPYDQYTQAGLFPVAYTIGTDFKLAKRPPADNVIRWNAWS
jgi:nitroreductase